VARQKIIRLRGVLYKDSRGRWRETRYSDATGRFRGGVFAQPPEVGTYYFSRAGRVRRATRNRRGALSSVAVSLRNAPVVIRYTVGLRNRWARAAKTLRSRVAFQPLTFERADGEGFTTLDWAVFRRRDEITNGQLAEVLEAMQGDTLEQDMHDTYPGCAIAKRFRDPTAGLEDWSGIANTDGFKAAVDRATFIIERDEENYGEGNATVMALHFMLFHQ
jgi:hypothetical protein